MNLGAWYGYEIIFLFMSNINMFYSTLSLWTYIRIIFCISKPKVTGRSMFIHLLIIIPNLQKNITQKNRCKNHYHSSNSSYNGIRFYFRESWLSYNTTINYHQCEIILETCFSIPLSAMQTCTYVMIDGDYLFVCRYNPFSLCKTHHDHNSTFTTILSFWNDSRLSGIYNMN